MWIDPFLTGAVFDDVRLDLAPTPEPGTLWLIISGVAAAVSRKRLEGVARTRVRSSGNVEKRSVE
jgi:PEP-CTERM putative exosortase interaction domain